MSSIICIAKWNADQRIQSSLSQIWESGHNHACHERLLHILESSITDAKAYEQLAEIVLDSFNRKVMPKMWTLVPPPVQRRSLELLHYYPGHMETLAKTFRWFDSQARSPRQNEDWCEAVQTVLGQLSIIDEHMTALKLSVMVQWTTELSEKQWHRIFWASILSTNSEKRKALSCVTRRNKADKALRQKITAFLTSLLNWDVFAKRRYLADELMVEGENVDPEFYEDAFVTNLLESILRKRVEDPCIRENDVEINDTVKIITLT